MRRLSTYMTIVPQYTFKQHGEDVTMFYRCLRPHISMNIIYCGNLTRIMIFHYMDSKSVFEITYDDTCSGETTFGIGDLYCICIDQTEDVHICTVLITSDFLLYEAERAFDYMLCRYCGYTCCGDYIRDNTTLDKDLAAHIKKCKQKNPRAVTLQQLLVALTISATAHRKLEYALKLCI